MENQTKKCPVCGKPVTQEEYDKALGLWEAKHAQIKHLEEEQAKLKQQANLLKKEKVEMRRATKRAVAEQKRKFVAEQRQHRELMKEEFKKKLESQTTSGITKGMLNRAASLKSKLPNLVVPRTRWGN